MASLSSVVEGRALVPESVLTHLFPDSPDLASGQVTVEEGLSPTTDKYPSILDDLTDSERKILCDTIGISTTNTARLSGGSPRTDHLSSSLPQLGLDHQGPSAKGPFAAWTSLDQAKVNDAEAHKTFLLNMIAAAKTNTTR